tara:strand:+ start:8122 stop:8505 length:384 start_codon:yes stop_codon:yes gene_type:complete
MDTKLFKKLIKDAVKEAIQEEMKDILLEAVRAPKTVIQESYAQPVQTLAGTPPTNPNVNTRDKYRELLGEMMDSRNGNISMTSNNALGFGQQPGYRPPATVNTAGEGSSLPAGEVNLDQIMGLMNKK